MLDQRTAIVNRLKFLSIVQQLARADLESAAAVVGLDALTGTLSLGDTAFAGGLFHTEAIVANPIREGPEYRGSLKAARSSSEGRSRLQNATTFSSRQKNGAGELITRPVANKNGEKKFWSSADPDTNIRAIGRGGVASTFQDTQRGRKNPAAAIDARRSASGSPRGFVDNADVRTLHAMLLGGQTEGRSGRDGGLSVWERQNGRAELPIMESAEPSASVRKKKKPEWDNRFGVVDAVTTRKENPIIVSNPVSQLKAPRYPLPQPQPAAPLNETLRHGGGLADAARPPTAPHQSVVGGSLASHHTGLATTGSLRDVNSSAFDSTLVAASGTHNSNASPNDNLLDTPTTANRMRRGSGIKARPRPKAASGGGGGSSSQGLAIQPSDFSNVDTDTRRRSMNTPVGPGASTSGQGASVSASMPLPVSPSSAYLLPPSGTGRGASMMPSPTRAVAGSMGSLGIEGQSGGRSIGTPGHTPMVGALSGGLVGSDADGLSALELDRAESEQRIREEAVMEERARQSEVDALREAAQQEEAERREYDRHMAGMAEASAAQVRAEEQKRQAAVLSHLTGRIERMLGDHTVITDRHILVEEALVEEGLAAQKLRSLQAQQVRQASAYRSAISRDIDELAEAQGINNGEALCELEFDRIQRRLEEQQRSEEAVIACQGKGTTPSADAVAEQMPRVRRRTGNIPKHTVDRVLQSRLLQHETIRYNEQLWNTSNTSQYAFADRLATVLMEDMLSEVCYGEVDAMLGQYIEGLADYELRLQ